VYAACLILASPLLLMSPNRLAGQYRRQKLMLIKEENFMLSGLKNLFILLIYFKDKGYNIIAIM
jgi:hypothetical protein